jgi:hypothetical protein
MPPTEAKAAETAGGQTRTLLIVLAVVATAAIAFEMWPEAGAKPLPSKEARTQHKAGQTVAGSLNVRLDELKSPPPQPGDAARNPFRYYVKPPPPPSPPKPIVAPKVLRPGEEGYVTPPPPPPPPIPLKFIGTVEKEKRLYAIFVTNDNSGRPPVYAAEGQLVLGQYKLVKIGVESVTMEYPDGRGRQIIPMRGQ